MIVVFFGKGTTKNEMRQEKQAFLLHLLTTSQGTRCSVAVSVVEIALRFYVNLRRFVAVRHSLLQTAQVTAETGFVEHVR